MGEGGLLYAWYGDDFTGSTDVLEVLASSGVPTVLFLQPPHAEHLARFPDVQAIGQAGDSRSRGPGWMDANLPGTFARLKHLGAPLTHYKVCSTFDSSPRHGSIGRALEIGRGVFGGRPVPILVGAPRLRRYVAFGQLFAAAPEGVFRIDRHPTMSRHPVTPMHEADLRLHLKAQTDLPIGLVDLPTLSADLVQAAWREAVAEGAAAVLFDGVDAAGLARAGQVVWAEAAEAAVFAVGSSGVTEALVPVWRAEGLIPRQEPRPQAPPAERLLVISGSCSPATAAQIEWSRANGFATLALAPEADDAAAAGCLTRSAEALKAGRSVVIHTALGPLAQGAAPTGESLGRRLGELLRALVLQTGVGRAVLAGGDTSSHAVQQLGAYALTWSAGLEPGAPLCRLWSDDAAIDGLELVLKGGQIGSADFFGRVRG